ncbi:MAG: chromosomal replication initiator protein DnaA [Actinobacteria bacterium]|nr:chromosomal replication initiator protein DnaA [Actinomycetota bacterium]
MPFASGSTQRSHAIDDHLTRIWDEARVYLQQHVNEATYRLFFAPSVAVALSNDTFTLGVASEFMRDWVEKRFGPLLTDALTTVLSTPITVCIVVDDRAEAQKPAESSPPDEAQQSTAPVSPAKTTAPGVAEPSAPVAKATQELNPRYTFARFVIGPHNEYAAAVANSVAESPATAYNPVFIYADTGLGKTHLVQAIAHAALASHPRLQFKYVTVERFTDDFINALTDKGRIEGFKQAYRDNDILLVDDVQFLAEKQQTQVEFFHTFNSLYEAGKQIVITSDRPPRELEALEERLRSRFGAGVVVDIGRPDLETRIAILRRQVKWDGLPIREGEVLEYIAARVTSNIRELHGALTRVVSFAAVRGGEITLPLAQEALKDILPHAFRMPVTVDAVQAEVARQFGCHISDLRGDRRTQDLAYARQVAMYISRDLTDASLPQIGERFGGRHHTTVLYAIQKIERLLKDGHDRQLHELVQTVTDRVKATR